MDKYIKGVPEMMSQTHRVKTIWLRKIKQQVSLPCNNLSDLQSGFLVKNLVFICCY